MKYKSFLFPIILCYIFLSSCAIQKNNMVKTIYIGPETLSCSAGVMQKECLQVKWSKEQKEWEFFYHDIADFDYELGYIYTLSVEVNEVENPPADASSLSYRLVKLLDKKAVCTSHLSKEEVLSKLKTEGLLLQPKGISEEEIARTPSYQPKATFYAEQCIWEVKSSTYEPVTYEGNCAATNGCTPEIILTLEVHAKTGEILNKQEERKLHPNYE